MSAASQRPHSSLRETTKINSEKANIEPSMEEILASIRRIIADDQAHLTPLSVADSINETASHGIGRITFEAEMLQESSAEEINVFQDTQFITPAKVEKTEVASARPDTKSKSSQKLATPDTESKPKPARIADSPLSEHSEESLLSTEAGASASSAFDSLSSLVLSRNPRTLDDLVQDMLRPMLKAWLDENLPPLVEKLVRAEIERISRGNR